VTVDELYEAFEQKLTPYAVSLTQDPQEAEDLIQDSMIRAMSHLALLGQLNPHQQRSWLFTTLRNLFLDRLQARQRRDALEEKLAEDEEDWIDDPRVGSVYPNPFDSVPEQFRDVVEMRFVQGMNSRQIADSLGISHATVRSRLHLAIKKLRERAWQWE
jgi:RNA polymerase sigma-70 factor (ECF subfamily)